MRTLNLVEFVGGPYCGKILAVDNLSPIKVDTLTPDGAACLGEYRHGELAKRGKMLWCPATIPPTK